jgi:acyl-CoA thioester hydrolase
MSEQISESAHQEETKGAFRFFHPIEIRYRDVDAQRHVNSAVYFTYLEQARANYLLHLGLWAGDDFDQIGIILAEQACSYRAPIFFGQPLEVGVCAERLGTKSLHFKYVLRHATSHQIFAQASTILVAYSYAQETSVTIPDEWREKIEHYEGTMDDADSWRDE